jgi:hypothetical protein
MGWPLPADTRLIGTLSATIERPFFQAVTGSPNTWKCPGCGKIVVMPPDCGVAAGRPADRCLDQLAQALCGCWVARLTDRRVTRLVGAIMAGDEALATGT